jgi:type IV pilus assembly protein PilF
MRLKWLILVVALLTACATQPDRSYRQQTAIKDTAIAHGELGTGYYLQGQLAIALDEFNKAVATDPNYAAAHNGLGLVYAALGEDAKAEASFKKALSLDAKSPEVLNNYGSYLCSRNKYQESVPYFLEAVKDPLYSSPEFAYLNAGLCSISGNDFKSAKAYLQQAYQIDPLLHRAAYELARFSLQENDAMTARKYLQNALVAAPSAPVLWLGVKIERILGDKNAVASYELQLRKNYPDSPETKELLSGK